MPGMGRMVVWAAYKFAKRINPSTPLTDTESVRPNSWTALLSLWKALALVRIDCAGSGIGSGFQATTPQVPVE